MTDAHLSPREELLFLFASLCEGLFLCSLCCAQVFFVVPHYTSGKSILPTNCGAFRFSFLDEGGRQEYLAYVTQINMLLWKHDNLTVV